jgi:hypothetical protein
MEGMCTCHIAANEVALLDGGGPDRIWMEDDRWWMMDGGWWMDDLMAGDEHIGDEMNEWILDQLWRGSILAMQKHHSGMTAGKL